MRIAFVAASVLVASAAHTFASNLRDTANRADYVIIAPTSYNSIAERLAAFRHEENGFATMVVDVDSITAQFGKGVSPDTALKSFIQYTLNNWSDPKPHYFVLAGNINSVPSHPELEIIANPGITSPDTLLMIDQWFVQVPDSSGTLRANACIGRFPAWDSTSLAVMVDKTIGYETDTTGAWCNRAISLADYREEDGSIFEDDAEYIRSYLDSLWTDTISVHVRSDSPCHLDSTGFVNLWNQGAAIVSYLGHADQTQLSYSKYFTTWSIDSLTNGDRLPLCLLGGCDLTFDTGPMVSIPTHLLEQQGGGAIAVISSEGLMFEDMTVDFYVSMIQSMIRNPGEPVGEAYEEVMSNWASSINDRFTFLGDPALTIKHPAVPTFVAPASSQPRSFALEQNYPNPFNPTTVISYRLSVVSDVSLKVYDVLGREVRTLVNGRQNAGSYSVTFNAGNLPSGVYFYRLSVASSGEAGNYSATKKLVILK